MNKWVKPIVGLVILLAFIIIVRAYNLDQRIGELQGWVQSRGVWAPIIFAGIYALATVLIIPGSILTVMAGAIFGSIVGVLTVIAGATVGAALCFLIARYFARETFTAILSKNEKFRHLDELAEKNGATIVAITRLVPLFPFNLLNFGFGLTGVPFATYVLWSAICMLPGTILYVVGTDAIITAINEGRVPWVLLMVVVFILIVLAVIVRRARRKLKE